MVSNPEEDWNGTFNSMAYELKPDHKRIKPVLLTPTGSGKSKCNLRSATSPERIIGGHEYFQLEGRRSVWQMDSTLDDKMFPWS